LFFFFFDDQSCDVDRLRLSIVRLRCATTTTTTSSSKRKGIPVADRRASPAATARHWPRTSGH
jgi:hypothetical protein